MSMREMRRTTGVGPPPGSPQRPIAGVENIALPRDLHHDPDAPADRADHLFNEAEYEIIELINTAHQKIIKLGLRANKGELASHVHGLQMFVVKHAIQRLKYKGMSRWFWSDD